MRLPVKIELPVPETSAAKSANIVQTVRDYSRRLFGFIRQRVPNDADAEDILQEVWMQLSGIVDVAAIDNIRAWLFTVARNKVTDRYRRKPLTSLDTTAEEEDEVSGSLLREMLLFEADTPELVQLRELFWEELFAALEELPAAQREVFIWQELEDQTFQEIADRTGENIKTLISRKRYAVQHLRKRLEYVYQEFFQN